MKSQKNLYSADIKSKTMDFFRKHVTLVILSGAAILLLGWWAYANFMPKPLGDRMEYLGKTDYGCYFICSSMPSSTYYYGTDMSMDEVIKYFKKTSIVKEPSTIDGKTYFGLKSHSGETIYANYYTEKNRAEEYSVLKKSSKPHILELPGSKYQVTYDSL